ncbi:MAG TPA: TA system VapC family ribonuclease toxin [Acidimicrobiales bacterium]|nr:TA system VapC family ribonuclease toxin [Acidimicrobiales bacterium]
MKLVDANVLIYAVNRDDPKHRISKAWLDGALSGGETVAFSWMALLAFLRIATKPGIFPRPLSVDEGLTVIERWVDAPAAAIVEPAKNHYETLAGLLRRTGTGGNLTTDAHLAALAAEHDADVVSFDADFDRFGISRVQPR